MALLVSSSKKRTAGFTLVELMVTVAIVGVLAALGVQGTRRYLAVVRTGEAVQNVGAISRGVIMAYEKQRAASEALKEGQLSTGTAEGYTTGGGQGGGAVVTHGSGIPYLCGSASAVPASLTSVKGRKYQPSGAAGKDYNSGNSVEGWKCVMFTSDSPQSYQYAYTAKGAPVNVNLPNGGSPPGLSKKDTWSVDARGDTDGDGVQSWFVMNGWVLKGNVGRSTFIGRTDEYE
jgi:prepilin-type N-terminal cleavage/methylation domain-containing protein